MCSVCLKSSFCPFGCKHVALLRTATCSVTHLLEMRACLQFHGLPCLPGRTRVAQGVLNCAADTQLGPLLMLRAVRLVRTAAVMCRMCNSGTRVEATSSSAASRDCSSKTCSADAQWQAARHRRRRNGYRSMLHAICCLGAWPTSQIHPCSGRSTCVPC